MKKIFEAPHGSYLYGTNTPESDMDIKGVFLNDKFSDYVLHRAPKHYKESTGNDNSKNTNQDVDMEYFEMYRFLQDLAKGETVAIDMLHTPKEMATVWTDEWQVIYDKRSDFYTTNMKAYLGYVRKQANKYGLKGSRMDALEQVVESLREVTPEEACECKLGFITALLPSNEYCFFVSADTKQGVTQDFYEVLGSKYQLTMPLSEFIHGIKIKWDKYGERTRLAKENQGLDWKAISHAFRAGLQLKEIYQTGDLQYPLKDRNFLLQVKRGELDWATELEPELINLVDEVDVLASNSNYPKKVSMGTWDLFTHLTYRRMFNMGDTQ